MKQYEIPEIHEAGNATELVKGIKPVGVGDNDAAPNRFEQSSVDEDE